MTRLIESIRKMNENSRKKLGNVYSPGRGVMTSANDFFFIKTIESTDDPEELLIETQGGVKERIEKEVLAPLVRGRHIDAWNFEIKEYLIWTHNDKGEVKKELPPRATKYFSKEEVRESLKGRSDYKSELPIWTIFRVSENKLKEKVAWQKIAHSVEAVYLPSEINSKVGNKKLIINSSVNFITLEDETSALSLTGILNSIPARTYVAGYVNRTGAADCQHFAWILGCLPVPKEVEEGETKELAEIAKELQEKGEEEENLTSELNSEVARLYGLSEDELTKMEDFLEFFTED